MSVAVKLESYNTPQPQSNKKKSSVVI